jgi:DNA sulfur modification protein DndE
MKLNKVILSNEASDRLKQLKGRTGLTPNILGRIGFCLSLSELAVPDPASYLEEQREFNRYTLLGEWDDLYIALLRQRLYEDGIPDDQAEAQFRAHLHRGIILLSRIAKSLPNVLRLASRAATAGESHTGPSPTVSELGP